ncbi:uncharacterized protein LOC116618940 [Nematostella vectensis]|nr:uncharacterized protein LOC116618940 [Nematostella vectensis]
MMDSIVGNVKRKVTSKLDSEIRSRLNVPEGLKSALHIPGIGERKGQTDPDEIPVVDDEFLSEGKRVDFVLVTVFDSDGDKAKENERKRRYFERSLQEQGLLIQRVEPTIKKQAWAGYATKVSSTLYKAYKDRSLKTAAVGLTDVLVTASKPIAGKILEDAGVNDIGEETSQQEKSASGAESSDSKQKQGFAAKMTSSLLKAAKDEDFKAFQSDLTDAVVNTAKPVARKVAEQSGLPDSFGAGLQHERPAQKEKEGCEDVKSSVKDEGISFASKMTSSLFKAVKERDLDALQGVTDAVVTAIQPMAGKVTEQVEGAVGVDLSAALGVQPGQDIGKDGNSGEDTSDTDAKKEGIGLGKLSLLKAATKGNFEAFQSEIAGALGKATESIKDQMVKQAGDSFGVRPDLLDLSVGKGDDGEDGGLDSTGDEGAVKKKRFASKMASTLFKAAKEGDLKAIQTHLSDAVETVAEPLVEKNADRLEDAVGVLGSETDDGKHDVIDDITEDGCAKKKGVASKIAGSLFRAAKEGDFKAIQTALTDTVETVAKPLKEAITDSALDEKEHAYQDSQDIEKGKSFASKMTSSLFKAVKERDLDALQKGVTDAVVTAVKPMAGKVIEQTEGAVDLGATLGLKSELMGAIGREASRISPLELKGKGDEEEPEEINKQGDSKQAVLVDMGVVERRLESNGSGEDSLQAGVGVSDTRNGERWDIGGPGTSKSGGLRKEKLKEDASESRVSEGEEWDIGGPGTSKSGGLRKEKLKEDASESRVSDGEEWGNGVVPGTSGRGGLREKTLEEDGSEGVVREVEGDVGVPGTSSEDAESGRSDNNVDFIGGDKKTKKRRNGKNKKLSLLYTLIHAPWEPLATCAENIMLRVPIHEAEDQSNTSENSWIPNRFNFAVIDNPTVRKEKRCINDFFTIDKFNKKKFLIKDKDNFFSGVDRSRMVFHIMLSAHFSEHEEDFGIQRLLREEVYDDAYNLHDGDVNILALGDKLPNNDRQRLVKDWASFHRWYKYQPLDAIKNYFGSRIAMYFAWLGTYTMMLISASIVGLICVLIGLFTTTDYPPVQDVCNLDNSELFYMCPLCDRNCSFWTLTRSCKYAKYSHAVDYRGTVFFAVFMSFWAVVFLEVWKRHQVTLAYQWDLTHFEDFEPPRPAFIATAKKRRVNPVTGKLEPYVSRVVRAGRYTVAGVAITMMILLVFVSVFGVVVYKTIVLTVMWATTSMFLKENSRIYTSLTSAVLNLLSIEALGKLYSKLAFALTDWENPRTRTEYQNILTVKMFLFQAVNMYSSFFYIAFFKTSLISGIPGNYRRIADTRIQGCDPSGCLMELCIQLAILLGGKQFHNQLKEILIPTLKRLWNDRSHRKMSELLPTEETTTSPQWELDQLLTEEPEFRIFEEYLEMVLQFGFVTMFVAAFPLAPLLALLNNILEIRSDAINFVVNYRRPTAERAQNIGAWLGVLQSVSIVAVVLNSFVIAFTSEFIPRQVYRYVYSPDGTLNGYVNNSLAYIHVDDLEHDTLPLDFYKNVPYNKSYCRFKEYVAPYPPYPYTKQFYYVLAARLAFVLLFNGFVFLTSGFIAWVIPDVPYSIQTKIKREEFLARETLARSQMNEGSGSTDRGLANEEGTFLEQPRVPTRVKPNFHQSGSFANHALKLQIVITSSGDAAVGRGPVRIESDERVDWEREPG